MAAEVKKEIQLEIAHVLFTDIVGYSKLPMNRPRALVERLNEIVRGTDEYQAAEAAGRLSQSRQATASRWFFMIIRKRQPNARWKSAALSRSIPNFSSEWACTVDLLAASSTQPEKRTWLALASISHSGSWTAAMPDTSCCRSMSLKISRNTLTGSRTCMNLASVK